MMLQAQTVLLIIAFSVLRLREAVSFLNSVMSSCSLFCSSFSFLIYVFWQASLTLWMLCTRADRVIYLLGLPTQPPIQFGQLSLYRGQYKLVQINIDDIQINYNHFWDVLCFGSQFIVFVKCGLLHLFAVYNLLLQLFYSFQTVCYIVLAVYEKIEIEYLIFILSAMFFLSFLFFNANFLERM